MATKGVHGRLWHFGCMHMSCITSGQDGRTPDVKRITGQRPDI
jgi:hypothetical protein